MKSLLIKPVFGLKGEITLSGDKSIAHRSIILSSLAPGKTTIENFPSNKDCQKTVSAFKKLGIKIRQKSTRKGDQVITVFGKGLEGLKKPKTAIFVGDSGTTLRLLLGVLAGQNFETKLIAGKSLSQRPMFRVTQPLRMMGAKIHARHALGNEEYPPVKIRGGSLRSITYKMPVASAQVKSAILLAGLYARGKTRVIEPISTRDHTERMLKLFKARIKVQQNSIVIKDGQELVSPGKIIIPGDISSASFFIALASFLPNAKLRIRKVSLNPSRYGVIRVLKRMGADIRVTGYALSAACLPDRQGRQGLRVTGYEPMGDIIVKGGILKGTVVKKEEMPSLIDELPILMVAASFAKGRTVFEGVGELRVKETDRIRSMSENLKKMGAIIQINRTAKAENIIIKGVKLLKGAKVKSFGDHRTAMSMVVAGLKAQGKTLMDDISCINKSFPDFLALLKPLIK
jgi:3-phosphoshikimate 1-carboxyvinyltransferase